MLLKMDNAGLFNGQAKAQEIPPAKVAAPVPPPNLATAAVASSFSSADKGDVDASPAESTRRMTFVPRNNDWDKQNVQIKVAKAMFANGGKYGCIKIRDVDDGR